MPARQNPKVVDDRPPPRKPSARSSAKARRSAARLTAVQIIYQSELTGQLLPQTLIEFTDYRIGQIIDGMEIVPADAEILATIIQGVGDKAAQIDILLAQVLQGTTPARLERLLAATLRAGIAELMVQPDIPTGIIISDYLSVIEAFYGGSEHKLVNAALDAAARIVRTTPC